MKPNILALLVSVACTASLPATAQVTGAGSTLVRSLMTDWIAKYGAVSGGVSYTPSGSSAGVKSVSDGSTDFGVTDVPLTAPALKQAQLRQVPLAATAVAIFVNVPELAGKRLQLSGDVLAEIYKGNIKEWNHSQIRAINKGLALPATAIFPVWRADGSGQSYMFTTYMSRHSASWRRTPGAEARLDLGHGKGVRGGGAMIAAVKATPGALGYESIGAVKEAGGLTMASLLNSAGSFVAPTEAGIQEALAQAQWDEETHAADLDGSAGNASYPIATLSYALIPQSAIRGRQSAAPFLSASVAQGDALSAKNGFVPLPARGKALAAKASR